MSVYAASAVVLHRHSLGEADRVVTLLTREYGKVQAVAKGARRPGSRSAGCSEVFTHAKVLLAHGRSLDIATQWDVVCSFGRLRGDLARLARAAYLCELTDKMVAEREHDAEVYDLLLSALHLLQRDLVCLDVIVHAYEMRLLSQRGYAAVLDHCVRCADIVAGGRMAFSPSTGGILCEACRGRADDAIPLAGQSWQAMCSLGSDSPESLVMMDLGHDAAREVGRCMRWFVRYRVERDLKSVEFLDMLRAED